MKRPPTNQRMKRYKDGELRVYYAKDPDMGADVIYHGGKGTTGADRCLLAYHLGSERPYVVTGKEREENNGNPIAFGKSLLDELESRGYDITTIEFRILKRKREEEKPNADRESAVCQRPSTG